MSNYASNIIEDLKNGEQEIQPSENVPKPKTTNYFKINTAYQTIQESSKRPVPKKLFSELWYENELCILFADTNVGKSILAVQIADLISRGQSERLFRVESGAKKVLIVDCELSAKQFELRYSDEGKNLYPFNDGLLRAEIDPDAEHPNDVTFEEYVNDSIEQIIVKHGIEVLIIDNISFLVKEAEKAKNAIPFMKRWKQLKNKYGLSVLILSHTPKRDATKPIIRNDLIGSRMLLGFADSCFAIGESAKDKSVRYIKQIKARNTEIVYDSENVILCEIKKENSFLHFDNYDLGDEYEHLKSFTSDEKQDLQTQVWSMKIDGKSFREIGKELGITYSKAKRLYDKENKETLPEKKNDDDIPF
jgi:RecA-family ATPase